MTIDSYWLHLPWDEEDPYELGMGVIASLIDEIIEAEAPEGLLSAKVLEPRPALINCTEVARILQISKVAARALAKGDLKEHAVRVEQGQHEWLLPRPLVETLCTDNDHQVTQAVAAAQLLVDSSRIYLYIRSGTLQAEWNERTGRWLIDRDSLDELVKSLRAKRLANLRSVTDGKAAEAIGCSEERVGVLRSQGYLVQIDGAPDGTVSEASLNAYLTSSNSPFLVTSEEVMNILGLTPTDFAALVHSGELVVVDGGLITRASFSAVTAALWRRLS